MAVEILFLAGVVFEWFVPATVASMIGGEGNGYLWKKDGMVGVDDDVFALFCVSCVYENKRQIGVNEHAGVKCKCGGCGTGLGNSQMLMCYGGWCCHCRVPYGMYWEAYTGAARYLWELQKQNCNASKTVQINHSYHAKA